MAGNDSPNLGTTSVPREGIELPESLRCDYQVVPYVRVTRGEGHNRKAVIRDGKIIVDGLNPSSPHHGRTTRMSQPSKSGAVAEPPVEAAVIAPPAMGTVARAKTAVQCSPRPTVVVIAAFPELFNQENVWMLKSADALLLEVDHPWTKANPKQIQNWIDGAYAEGKQVIATGTPQALHDAVAIRRRNVTTIQKSGAFEKLVGQELADKVSLCLEEMFKRIPRRKPLGPTRAPNKSREPWPVSHEKRNLSPAYYQQVLSVDEEKELDRILDRYDQ